MPPLSRVVAQTPEAASIRSNNRVYELRRRGREIIVLSAGEAYFDIPLQPFEALPYPSLYHYSHSRGIPELREKIAGYYAERYGVAVDSERELVVTAGSKAAIYMAMMSVLDPGDEVLIHEPTWVSFPEHARFCHAVPVMMPYQSEVGDYARYLSPRTRLIIVNNPNNPRGRVFTRTELQYLVDVARERDIYILADEAYSDFVENDRFHSLGGFDGDKGNVIVCNSISKNFGMSGWRIGYLISNPALIQQALKVNQHLITCAPTVLQQYIARYFDTIIDITMPQIRDVVRKRRELGEYIEGLGLKVLPGSATFYFFVSIAPSALSSEEFCDRLLDEHGVSVVPGSGYGASCDSFVRVSIGAESLENVRAGLQRISALIDATSAVVIPFESIAPKSTAAAH
jgi:aminotransferase